MANNNDPVSVECLRMVKQTVMAYGVNHKTDANAKNVTLWLPKSQVELEGDASDEDLVLVMPRWLAEKNDLPYSD